MEHEVSDFVKRAIEAAMPGWEVDRATDSVRKSEGMDRFAADQSGVDFEALKRKYLPNSGPATGSSGSADLPSTTPDKGSVVFEKVSPKYRSDSDGGSKTVVYDVDRGVVGTQG